MFRVVTHATNIERRFQCIQTIVQRKLSRGRLFPNMCDLGQAVITPDRLMTARPTQPEFRHPTGYINVRPVIQRPDYHNDVYYQDGVDYKDGPRNRGFARSQPPHAQAGASSLQMAGVTG